MITLIKFLELVTGMQATKFVEQNRWVFRHESLTRHSQSYINDVVNKLSRFGKCASRYAYWYGQETLLMDFWPDKDYSDVGILNLFVQCYGGSYISDNHNLTSVTLLSTEGLLDQRFHNEVVSTFAGFDIDVIDWFVADKTEITFVVIVP